MESLLFSFKYDCVNITVILFSSGIISTDVDIQTRIRRSREGMRRKKVPLTPPCFFYNKNWTTFCIQCTIDTSLVSRALLELFRYFSFNNLSFFSVDVRSIAPVISDSLPIHHCHSSSLYLRHTVPLQITRETGLIYHENSLYRNWFENWLLETPWRDFMSKHRWGLSGNNVIGRVSEIKWNLVKKCHNVMFGYGIKHNVGTVRSSWHQNEWFNISFDVLFFLHFRWPRTCHVTASK